VAEADEVAQVAEVGQRKFRPDIEGLRAVAVIAVVLSHSSLGLPGGYIGVDVFFVISGFLITRQLLQEAERRGRFSFAGFYARRARRIVPAATVVTVATLFGAYLWAPPLRLGAIARDGLAAALFGVNWRLAAQGTNYFQASSPPSPFQHYWSLSVEEQFYLAWPLVLAVVLFTVRKRERRTKARALVAVLTAVIAASLWASIHVTNISAPYGYFGTHTRVWELAVGALIAATADSLLRLPRPLAAVIAWLGLAAIVISCFIYGASTMYPGAAAILPVAGAALIIAAGCGAAPSLGPERLLTIWPMRWTGRISYSLYLWHWPLLILIPDAVGHPLTLAERCAAIGAAVLLSVLTYVLVEQPFQHQRILVTKPHRGLALGTGLIAASVAVALVVPAMLTLPAGVAIATTDSANVQAALAAAASQTQLPTTVVPLAQASTDYPNSDGCEVDDSAESPKLPCNGFGDQTGTTQVVLIGDSHAGMWLGAVNSIAIANHWKLTFFAKSGCPIGDYPDFVSPTLKRTYTECNAWRPAAIADVVALHPALIIVGSQARSIDGTEPDGLEKSIASLKSSGATMVFLADTPSPAAEGSIPDCLSVHPTDIERCAIPRAEAALDSAGRQAEIKGAERAGATVIDPTPWFCTASSCPAVVQNVIVYEDNSHISATYALLRAPDLQRALPPITT
jgi:peptidoglycan/LPS O-acetylase OafA/YrhL